MESDWWVTVVRAWPQAHDKSRLVIRMINTFGTETDDRSFASIEAAVAQLRHWLQELEHAPAEWDSERQARNAETTQMTQQHDD